MNDNNINKFFKEHKQPVENGGFNERLFSHLDYLPTPAPRVDRSKMIVTIFATIGLLVFVLLGGHNSLISGLSSSGTLFGDYKLIRPEVVVPVIFMICSLFALGRFAIKEQ